MSNRQHPYEEPLLLLLLVMAVVSLIWLFAQFIPALLFALLLAVSSYPIYQWLLIKLKGSPDRAAALLTSGAFLVVILPFSYLLIEGGRMGADFSSQLHQWLEQQPPGALLTMERNVVSGLPLSETMQGWLQDSLENQLPVIVEKAKSVSLWLATNLLSGVVSLVGFVAISLFSLFFFYRDGHKFIRRLVHLSPLSNYLDHFILNRFASLSTVLTLSVVGVALLQGAVFSVLMLFLGLPWLFLGLAYALASFVPIVGGFLIWGPVSLYFLAIDRPDTAVLTAAYSTIIIGIGIDNLLRPIVIQRLNRLHATTGQTALDHTWITLLSTFAGLLHFGIMGLIFGPMLAAMAITIFDVYEHKHRHQLDYS